MKPFLETNGFTSPQPEWPQPRDTLAHGSAGVAISLALTSSINLKIDEVIEWVRSTIAKLPLVFKGFRPFEKCVQLLERLAKQIGLTGDGLAVSVGTESSKALGTPEGCIYVSKDDLTNPMRCELTARLLKRHFH